MAWYEIYNRDEDFEKYYDQKPHLYKTHKKYFDKCNDEYLELANHYHPSDYDEWVSSLGKLFNYEKELYAKVDTHKDLIIISYYNLDGANVYYNYTKNCYCRYNTLYMRFIYDTKTTAMYHYRMKRFRYVTYVLNSCDGKYQMGSWTDMDKFYSQVQRQLDDKSIQILKSLDKFKYLPIEQFNKINVYNLFQVNEETIYQYEILLKNKLTKLASDLLVNSQFITTDNFKRFKSDIMNGIRLQELNQKIYSYNSKLQQKRLKANEKLRKKKEKELKILRKQREEEYPNIPKLKFDLGEYILRQPESRQELEFEGKELDHCVASYFDKILDGTTSIFLLRKKEQPNKPFYTVEIKNEVVTQVRTIKNKTNPEMTELVKQWNQQRLQEQVSNY